VLQFITCVRIVMSDVVRLKPLDIHKRDVDIVYSFPVYLVVRILSLRGDDLVNDDLVGLLFQS